MSAPKGRLTPLQVDVLHRFFSRTDGFFLTGGAVLCGWELAHRTTDDLDLFTTSDEAMLLADATVRAVADDTSCSLRALTTAPDFRRYELHRGAESLILDVVRDRVPQLREKVVVDGVRMDSVEEIFVNKICALVGRSELRDLVDLRALEEKGYRVEDYLELAQKKDGGATAATLAWLLSTLAVPPDLAAYAKGLEARMLAVAKRDAE
jgi:predicted nucleotidyltransferase